MKTNHSFNYTCSPLNLPEIYSPLIGKSKRKKIRLEKVLEDKSQNNINECDFQRNLII